MTMWTPYGDVDPDVSDLPGIDLPHKRRRSRRRAWRDGLADQTVVRELEDIRAYRALERALIGNVDPRSAIELALFHRLANLLWRLRRASAIETALFEIQGGALLVRRAEMSRGHLETLQASARANGHDKVPDRPPLSGPPRMLVYGWPLRQRGRRGCRGSPYSSLRLSMWPNSWTMVHCLMRPPSRCLGSSPLLVMDTFLIRYRVTPELVAPVGTFLTAISKSSSECHPPI